MRMKRFPICFLFGCFWLAACTAFADDWTYYRELSFDSPTGGSVVAVDLSPQTLGSPYANFQPDGADLRFTLPDQTEPLDYWVESWNSAGNSRVWVDVPPAATEQIWMRYGNAQAQSADNGRNVFGFFDDFNDGIWRKYANNPVITRTEPWEARAICESSVLYEDGIYKMWYMGCATSVGTNAALGYATSPDGLNWTKLPGNPILQDPTEAVIRTTVVKNQGAYYLFASDYQWNDAPGNIRRWTSADGLNWTDKTVVLQVTEPWESGMKLDNTSVIIEDDGTWKMLYVASGGGIGYAHSPDGLNWTKHPQPVMSGFYGGDPYLTKIDGTYYAWHSQIQDGELLTYARKSTDMINWQMVGNSPQVGYTQPWERGVGRPEVWWTVHITDTELMEHDGQVWMYYQGAQNPMGVAWFDGTMQQLGEAMENPPMQQWAASHYHSVEDKQLKVSHNATNSRPIYENVERFSDQEGYVFETRAHCYGSYTTETPVAEDDSLQMMLVMRYVNDDNMARFRLVGNSTTYYEERIGGTWSTPVDIGANGAMDDQWHDLMVLVDGNLNEFYVDDLLIGTATGTLFGRTDFKVGVATQDAFVAFDDMRVLRGGLPDIGVTVGAEGMDAWNAPLNPPPVGQKVVYREIFPSGLDANTPPDTVGWNIHHDATGEEYDGSSAGGGYGAWNVSAAAAAGLPADLAGVNSSPHLADKETGYLFFNKDGDTQTHNVLAWTEEVAAANVDKADLAEISWYEANADATEMRLALKIADGWYVSDATFDYVSSTMTGGVKMTVSDFSGADWNPLTFIAGTELSRSDDLIFLPEGLLQAAGIYTDDMLNNSTSHRFDTFEIQKYVSVKPGDANMDGIVNAADAALLAGNWQKMSGATWGDGDFNGDGKVDDQDATLLAANWQSTGNSSASVPEPGMMVILAGSLLVLCIFRAGRP